MSQRNRPMNWLAVAAGALAGAAYISWLRPRMLTWGSSADEIGMRLAGDEMITQPTLTITRAVDINAPVEAVWPFIAQMGRSGTGWYAFDLPQNGGVPSYSVPRRDLPAPQPGMAIDRGFTLAYVEPTQALVFTGALPTDRLAESWSSFAYVLQPLRNGTRLLTRVRVATDGILGQAELALIFEPLNFFMTVQQLKTIKMHAETFATRRPDRMQYKVPDGA